MRTPSTTQEELVGAIAEALKPWANFAIPLRYPASTWAQNADREAEVKDAVRSTIEWIRAKNSESFARNIIRKTRADGRAIAATLEKLQRQYDRATADLRSWVEPTMQELQIVNMQDLRAEHDRLHEICITAAEAQPRSDRCKAACAELAVGLMLAYSTTPHTGGRNKPLRHVASLLFEAATGKGGADLERACRAALRNWTRKP